jgi:hypothetical protein
VASRADQSHTRTSRARTSRTHGPRAVDRVASIASRRARADARATRRATDRSRASRAR